MSEVSFLRCVGGGLGCGLVLGHGLVLGEDVGAGGVRVEGLGGGTFWMGCVEV